ncbi:hypothetical protein NHX12_025886 [Muraenolepis orangiensis]|uniref:Soluble scavenger receptor cysteine-rich domain-containing protein SSC5D n=1 Tax=Muraenolepis orangiensis TaxID=630683 RepID=A0A9Q0EJ76_9TELE|nr:hypothetical protein NHX12_025886 [Muraenolepis orangiensis]
MRLVGGPNSCSGRVEIYHAGEWGTVCDDEWTILNTAVVCRSVNCGAAMEVRGSAFYGEGKDRIWLDNVHCSGLEASLHECRHEDYGINNCAHGEDVGIVCSDYIKLANGIERCEGRVEVKHGTQWRKLCNSSWSQKEQEVLCREVSCGMPQTGHNMPDFGEHSTLLGVKASCLGNETALQQCVMKETDETCDSASIVCIHSKAVRLVNGTHPCSGRVEVMHEGLWGTVCDDNWGLQEAEVVCREMKCGTALSAKFQAHYGLGSGRINLDELGCKGHEKTLTECPHGGFGVSDCTHMEDAGVECAENVKLVNGTRCSGRLEVHHQGQWVTICKDSHWGSKEETLVCKELDCGTPKEGGQNSGGSDLERYAMGCLGTESSVAACPLQPNPTTCSAVSVSCSGQPELKLINGTDRCSGRVEVQHDGQWGTVCDDLWEMLDAWVVCKAMDCGSPLNAKSGAFYGQGKGNVWLDDLQCLGNETSLKHCQHTDYGDSNCGHSEDAGVHCSMTIRLLDGRNHCSGRVEIFQGGFWAPVYNGNWGFNEALVVCKEMQCGEPVVTSTADHFGQSSQSTGYTTSCNGRESSISQCSLRGYSKTVRDQITDATVSCSGNVRLANGSNACTGRVEVYQGGQWGTICNETWDMQDAAVVCKSLQCGSVQKMSIASSACNSSSVAGVLCSDGLPTRLVHSTGECFGRVEVQHAGQWGTLCGKDWSMSAANVVCSLLGCGSAISISSLSVTEDDHSSKPVWEASEACFNSEASLFECSVSGYNGTSCGHEQDASVVCADPLRLVNGRNQCSGRLEVFHHNLWGTVCDDEWEMDSANVVCRQLGCGEALSFFGSSEFGAGGGPIWLDNVVCSGEEEALNQCPHQPFGENNCGHSEDVGIICLGNMPKPHISLSPGPDVNFGDKVEITCSVLSDHLGGTYGLQKTPGPFRMQRYSESDAVTFTIPKANLSHGGLYHCTYQKRFMSKTIEVVGDSLELKVSVKLPQPIISLPSVGPMMLLSTNKIDVKGGSSFAISCSIFSSYEGGSFYLRKSNITATRLQAALSHSIIQVAYFDFPDVSERDQGDYACVYTLNVSTQSYHSPPSKTLLVVVSGSAVSSTITGSVVGLSLLLILSAVVFLLWRRRGLASRTMVQFSSRVGEVMKEDSGDKRDGPPTGRDYNTLANEYGNGSSPEEKCPEEVESTENTLERNATEDLTGRVCYELEPLIHS